MRNDAESTPKVLQVLGDSVFGGATVHSLTLSTMLREHGLSVALLSTDGTTTAEFKKAGIPVFGSAAILRDIHPLSDLKAVYKLWRFLRKNRFDIVHTHMSKPGFVGRLAARMVRVPIVFHTSHRFAFDVSGSALQRWLFFQLERLAARWTTKLLVVSQENYNLALEHNIIPRERIAHIPNSIDAENYDVGAAAILRKKAELGLEPDVPVVGMVARLQRPKLPADFVQACKLLSKRWPSARFLLIGDGPQQAEMESLVKRCQLNGQFILTGFRRDIPELLAVLDVFVLPTLWEGMCLSILEAMAAGKPIVTTDIEPNREIVQDGKSAILVPPHEPEVLAAAIERLLVDHVLAAQMGTEAREAVAQRFNHEELMNDLWASYEAALRKKPIIMHRV